MVNIITTLVNNGRVRLLVNGHPFKSLRDDIEVLIKLAEYEAFRDRTRTLMKWVGELQELRHTAVHGVWVQNDPGTEDAPRTHLVIRAQYRTPWGKTTVWEPDQVRELADVWEAACGAVVQLSIELRDHVHATEPSRVGALRSNPFEPPDTARAASP